MFTTPCFIRKNTPELREKLEELGYEYNGCDSTYGTPNNLYCSFNSYYELSGTSKPSRYERIIDCRTNEELFLALAALRDDSDYMQWFIDGEKWFKFGGIIQNGFIIDIETHLLYHKATAKEIIEYFKDK